MGILRGMMRGARRVGHFADGAAERMGQRAGALNYTSDRFAPISSAVYGAVPGALVGGYANPDDPLSGALMGAGIGAAGGAGLSVARQLGAGVMGGVRRASALKDANPAAIADEIRALSKQSPEEARRYLDAIARENEELLRAVLAYL